MLCNISLYFLVYSHVFLFCLLVSDLPACIWILRLKPSWSPGADFCLTLTRLEFILGFGGPPWLMVYGLCLVILSHIAQTYKNCRISLSHAASSFKVTVSLLAASLTSFRLVFTSAFDRCPVLWNVIVEPLCFHSLIMAFTIDAKRGFGNIYILCPKILPSFYCNPQKLKRKNGFLY